MKKYLLLGLLASSAILTPMLTYANTAATSFPNPVCILEPTDIQCIIPPVIPVLPPAN
ncbi:conserved exported hypothetical protein [Xenorhabdus innexi]|uniref:Uncharacterized protein n=1 Tax=Xenorhabdus innexi TaxID=290109 RepID=A0A1N6MXN0_9GAMM|nr:hypothetical protein Xinn_03676 [Xenorhabdus innexi]SIP73537.1 conserved exported hypothetical protein [Xenorhabdus innexi]